MKKLEQKFCTELQKWIKYNMKTTFCWEAKVIEGDRMNFNQHLPEHQIRNLKNCNSHFVYKISDADMMCQKPFDGVSIANAPGYLFIYFYKPRRPKLFYLLSIDTILNLIKNGYKSITEEDAKKLAAISGELK